MALEGAFYGHFPSSRLVMPHSSADESCMLECLLAIFLLRTVFGRLWEIIKVNMPIAATTTRDFLIAAI